ncbi:hypothetical protein AVEN_160319-1 [Araneus ventricosus]|uniref:Uncharacterized protein n=1 Tax=Araneus ventricosus TaxID=182803 RepID=A0A4Y2F941_ARAVE|nr:hypothetical protein AVEN_160319-1 [Araneus ventricosus]
MGDTARKVYVISSPLGKGITIRNRNMRDSCRKFYTTSSPVGKGINREEINEEGISLQFCLQCELIRDSREEVICSDRWFKSQT